MFYSPTNAVNTEHYLVPHTKTKSVNVSVNSGQKSETTIARTWTEEGDKCAEQPVHTELCRATKETRWH
jgi:hypothetical protein